MDETTIIFVATGIERGNYRRSDLVPVRKYGDTDIAKDNSAALVHRREEPVRRLESAEGDRHVERRNGAELGSAVTFNAARQIASDTHDRLVAKPRKLSRNSIFKTVLEAGSEQAIDEDRGRSRR